MVELSVLSQAPQMWFIKMFHFLLNYLENTQLNVHIFLVRLLIVAGLAFWAQFDNGFSQVFSQQIKYDKWSCWSTNYSKHIFILSVHLTRPQQYRLLFIHVLSVTTGNIQLWGLVNRKKTNMQKSRGHRQSACGYQSKQTGKVTKPCVKFVHRSEVMSLIVLIIGVNHTLVLISIIAIFRKKSVSPLLHECNTKDVWFLSFSLRLQMSPVGH